MNPLRGVVSYSLKLLALVIMTASLVACNIGAAAPADSGGSGLSGSIQVRGSDTMVNLSSAWAEQFMDNNPNVDIAVTGGGSGTGIAALIDKTVDICQASRAIKAEEIERARANGVEPHETVVALDGLALIVHPSNPVNELTFEQLADIYTGTITNWQEVGGANAPLVALSRDTNSGTHVFFKEHVVQSKAKDAEYGPDVLMMPSTQAGVDETSQNPNAIMYVGLGYAGVDTVKMLAIKQDAGAPAIKPTQETVKSGEYNVARPLFLYTDGEPSGLIKSYLDWIVGPEGQEIVRDLEFVPAY